MYNFWIWVWVAAWIVGFIMWGLFLTAIFRWSAKKAKKDGKGEFPRQIQYNVPLEMVLTIVPILIIMGLFFFTVQTQQKVTALDKDPKVVVDVTAFQWNWKFGYAENHVNGENYDGADKARQAEAEKTAHDPEGVDNPNPIHGKSTGDLSYLNYNKIETVGTTEEVTIGDVAQRIAAIAGREIEFVSKPAPAGGTDRRCPDIAKLKKLGYAPQVPLDQGLRPTVEWYWANERLAPRA